MKKTFSILFLFFFLASCGKGGSGGSSADATAIATKESAIIEGGNVSNEAITFDVRAKYYKSDRDDEEKVEEALELIKRVVSSETFKKRVLNYTYKGKKAFIDNGGLSNAKVYAKILAGAEKLGNRSANNRMDVELEFYHDSGSIALGYTYPSAKRIWINKKYFNSFKAYQVAGNLFHEWLHKLGFKHSVKADADRPHSVPYALGYLIRDLARELDT